MTPTAALVTFLSTLPLVANSSAGVFVTAAPSVADLGTDAPAVVVQLVSASLLDQTFQDATPRRYTYEVGVTASTSHQATTVAIATAIHDAVHDVLWNAGASWAITGSLVTDLIEESPRDPESEDTYYNLGMRLTFDAAALPTP